MIFLAALPISLSQRFYRIKGYPIELKEKNIDSIKFYLLPVILLVTVFAFQRIGYAFECQWANISLKKATLATQMGNWDDAIDDLNGVLKLCPQDINALYLRDLFIMIEIKRVTLIRHWQTWML